MDSEAVSWLQECMHACVCTCEWVCGLQAIRAGFEELYGNEFHVSTHLPSTALSDMSISGCQIQPQVAVASCLENPGTCITEEVGHAPLRESFPGARPGSP